MPSTILGPVQPFGTLQNDHRPARPVRDYRCHSRASLDRRDLIEHALEGRWPSAGASMRAHRLPRNRVASHSPISRLSQLAARDSRENRGFAILYPFKWRIGNTVPSLAGFRNLFECQAVASGPVSASPSPMTQATKRSGLSNAAPKACEANNPSSPPSLIEPGTSGAQWLGNSAGKGELLEQSLHAGRIARQSAGTDQL